VGIITKSSLVRRDIDILTELVRNVGASVHLSVAFSDDEMSRKIEPWAPSPSARFRTMRFLAEAGIPVGVSLAPIIPGLNDSQIAEVLARAKDNGATRAFRVLLRLPAEVKPVFTERLKEAFPDRAERVLGGVRAVRGGALNQSEFGSRMRGEGPRWQAIEWLFDQTCTKLGLETESEDRLATPTSRRLARDAAVRLDARPWRKPTGASSRRRSSGQLDLFP
jgi:DNA repair photolyase